MGILSFSMFRGKVQSGEKWHTIRFRQHPPTIGEAMSIWWKSRTAERKMIGVSIITRVDTIGINPKMRDVILEGTLLKSSEVETLAKSDGFESVEEFWEYFKDVEGTGFLICWDPDYITRRRILPWVLEHGEFKTERPKQRREYTPSNGTETMQFAAEWCEQCDRDKNNNCPVLMAELGDEKGAWLKHENKGYCSVFKPKIHTLTARIAASQRQLERKGQLNLLNEINL